MEFFPDANPLAVDLLSRMLKFNPAERIPVMQALTHPYLAQLQNPVRVLTSACFTGRSPTVMIFAWSTNGHCCRHVLQADEPVCVEAFNFDFERASLELGVEMPKEELQRLVFQECMSIHPIEAHRMQ